MKTIFTLLALFLLSTYLHAKTDFTKALAQDRSIVQGQLANGFSYSIKKNAKPKDTAELLLLLKAGSLEEDEDQQGIAHFVEHMAFNGTTHFPGNKLIDELESLGVNFGSHLNASTSADKTLYKLSIPLEQDNLQKAFLIMSDWASEITFDENEVEKERGIILEEERSRNKAQFRLYKQYMGALYGDTRYVKRLPIGKKQVIKNIPPKRVKDFYDTWYRPELMHLVVVGDFDLKKVEGLIIKSFAGIKNSSTKKSYSRDIPTNNTTRVVFAYDKEYTSNDLSINYLSATTSLKNEDDLKKRVELALLKALFNLKAKEQLQKKDPYATTLSMSSLNLKNSKALIAFNAKYNEGDHLKALNEVYSLMQSYAEFGFSQEYMDVAKKQLLQTVEQQYKKRHEQNSKTLANKLLKAHMASSVIMDETTSYALQKKYLHAITLQELNQAFSKLIKNQDRIILFTNNSKLPTNKSEVLSTLHNASLHTKDLSKEQTKKFKLAQDGYKSTSIVKETYHEQSDSYEFILANGVKVLFKPTDFEKGTLHMHAFSFGGTSLYMPKEILHVQSMPKLIQKSGMGQYSTNEIIYALADKDFSTQFLVTKHTDEIKSKMDSKDIETHFQLLHLQLTKAKVDHRVLENTKQQLYAQLPLLEKNPNYNFQQKFTKDYYQNNPRDQFLSQTYIDDLNSSKLLHYFHERYSDMNNFSYIFVGDIDVETLKLVLVKYLASFAQKEQKEEYILHKKEYLKGERSLSYNFNEQNIAQHQIIYQSNIPYSLENEVRLNALTSILKVKLRQKIREENSGVYGIGVKSTIKRSHANTNLTISFTCDPKRSKELIGEIFNVVDNVKKDISQDEIQKFQKKYNIGMQEAVKTNKLWLQTLLKVYKYNDSLSTIEEKQMLVHKLSKEQLLEVAAKLLAKDRMIATNMPKVK